MDAFSIRFILLHLTGAVGTWIVLFLMNERDPHQRMARWKIALCIVSHYFLSLGTNFLLKTTKFSIFEFFAIPMMLIGLLICCVLFTGGVVKIFLSILISDLWGGMNELLASFLYCLISGRKLEMLYIYEMDGDVLVQFLFEILIWTIMILLTRPLFLKFRKLPILEGKLFAFLFIGYFSLGAFLRVSPTSFFEGTVARYQNTLTFMVCYSCIFIFFLGYNRKNLMQLEIQSLYLKQKLQQEYGLVFQDMEKGIQCFRHDVRKHLDALDYLENHSTLQIPQEQLKQYRSNLNAIYQELTCGNYCNTMDINVILMQLDKYIDKYIDKPANFSVSLRNLETDSLPVYLRMQLFEKISDWTKELMDELMERQNTILQNVSVTGMTHAGYHTLKFIIQVQLSESPDKKVSNLLKKIRRKLRNAQNMQEIRRFLHKHSGTCRMEKRRINEANRTTLEITLTAAWHGKP